MRSVTRVKIFLRRGESREKYRSRRKWRLRWNARGAEELRGAYEGGRGAAFAPGVPVKS